MRKHPIHLRRQGFTRRSLMAAALSLSLMPSVRADYASEILSESPIVYYRFDDAVATDDNPSPALNLGSLGAAGNGAYIGSFTRGVAGALTGNTAVAFTQPNATAIDFTGGINIPNNVALNPPQTGTNPFTVECWVKPNTNTSTLLSPVNSMSFTTGRAGFLIYQNGAKWQLRMGNKASTTATFFDDNVTGGAVIAGQWQHLAATYSGGISGTMTLYVNGVSVGSATVANYESNDNAPFVIGGTSSPNRTFDGAVDEVAFYGSLLPASTISARVTGRTADPAGYQAAVLADSPVGYWRLGEAPFTPRTSPVAANAGSLGTAANGGYYLGSKNSNTGPSSTTGFPGFSASNSALSLATASGYVSPGLGLLNNRSAFTVMGWVKRGAVHSLRGGYFGQNDLLEFGDAAAGASIETYVNAGGSLTTVYTAADDVWQFIALSASGTSNTLYIDGVQVAQASTTIANYGTSAFNFNIGGGGIFAPTGDFFLGEIDEVAVFDKAISAGRIKQFYDTALGNVEPGIVNQIPSVSPLGDVPEGQPYTLSVDVTGTPPFTYQWFANGTPISGATGKTYTVPAAVANVPQGDPYVYTVAVTNGVKTVTSDPIEVYITPVLRWTSTAAANAGKWDIDTLAPSPLNWKTFTTNVAKAYTDDYAVQFDDTAATTSVELTQDVIPLAVVFDNSTKDYTLTGGFTVRGPFPAISTKKGTGTVVIANSLYDVDFFDVTAGKLQIGNGTTGALGASTVARVAGGQLALNLATGSIYANKTTTTGGMVSFGGTGDISVTAEITGTANEVFNGTGVTTINSLNSVSGTVTVNSGTVSFDGNQSVNRLAAGKLVTVNPGATMEIHGVNALPTAANSVNPTLNQGTLRVFTGGSTVVGATGQSHAHLGTLTLNGGSVVLAYSGQGSAYSGESFQLNGGIVVTGTVASTIANGNLATAGNAGMALSAGVTHTVTVPNVAIGADLVISTEIENADTTTPTAILAKTGEGTLLLAGGIVHPYSGATQIDQGTLQASGSIAGPVAVAAGAFLDPGPSTAGFTTGALTLDGTYSCEINGAASDRVDVNGNVTINATGKIAFSTLAGGATAPFYEILKATGTITGTPIVAGMPAGYTLTVSATSISIVQTGLNPQPTVVATPPSGSENFNTTAGGFTVSAAVSPQTDWAYSTGSWLSFGTDNDVGGATHTSYLTTPVYTVKTAGTVTMSFSHSYNFEVDYDAGAVEISINGAAFTRLPGSAFTANGYNGILAPITDTNSALDDQEGFLGMSAGNPAYLSSTATLLATAAVGDTVQVRFMGAYDDAYSPGGWKIDSFDITNALPQLMTLTWPLGTMQYSDNLQPPWVDLTGKSPLLIDTKAAPKRFFRLKP